MARQYHIALERGEVAPTILLCGDVERAEKVARHFEKIRVRRTQREFITFTGSYRGIPLSVMGTGIGPGNTEIAVVEISQLVKSPTFLRLGSCGGLQPNIKIGDLVITTASVRLENTSLYLVPEGYPAASHYEVLLALVKACEESRLPYHVGLTASAPGFYSAQGRSVKPFHSRTPRLADKLARLNVLNFEMETSTLFTLATLAGFRAGAICTVYTQRAHHQVATARQRAKAETRLIQAGLASVVLLDTMDKAKRTARKKLWYPACLRVRTGREKL